MSLRHTIENVTVCGPQVWTASLTAAEVRRLGEPKSRTGQRSVVAIRDAHFDAEAHLLSFSPEKATALNIGSTDETLIIDIGNVLPASLEDVPVERHAERSHNVEPPEPLGSGDAAFLAECRRHFRKESLVRMGTELLAEIRKHYPGKLIEGQARKWVNYPGNFVALTIQNRDQSFAIHVKGRPEDFKAPTLDIRPDRGTYCRFKLETERQYQDAAQVVLQSASRSED
jgi:hypothetical protein